MKAFDVVCTVCCVAGVICGALSGNVEAAIWAFTATILSVRILIMEQ